MQIIQLKGTVSVILGDAFIKNGNARFTTVRLINNLEDIVVFLRFKMFNSDNSYICFPAAEMRDSHLWRTHI